jgi:hypothetical protein
MKKAIVFAGFLAFAATAHAQSGFYGSLNNAGSYASTPGLGSAGSLNSTIAPFAVRSSGSAGGPASSPNVAEKNPGEFVPSTFANYKDAVSEARANANKKPMTLADLARQAQAEKKASAAKTAMVLEEGTDGKLVIANPKKQ